MKKQSGFTLIELLLVLAIIGIISAIAIPALLGQRENSRQKATEAAANNIKSEIVVVAQQIRATGVAPTGANVITALAAMPQFAATAAKNAYTPTAGAYQWNANATADGQVGVNAGTVAGADGVTYDVINVSYQHKRSNGGAGTPVTTPVALDQ